MQEAEVAQQLFNDLQANIGIVAAAILALAITGLIAMTAVASNAARAMREVRETLSVTPASSGPAARSALSDNLAESIPAFSHHVRTGSRPETHFGARDIISAGTRHGMPSFSHRPRPGQRSPAAAHWSHADSGLRPQRPRPQAIQRRLI